MMLVFRLAFFFSSRRRHTRCLSDWSSDVCSSDLIFITHPVTRRKSLYVNRLMTKRIEGLPMAESDDILEELFDYTEDPSVRSEERRVGKECSGWGCRYHEGKVPDKDVPDVQSGAN